MSTETARSLVAIGRLVAARLWRQRFSAVLVVCGVASSAALLAGISVVAVVSRDAAMERALHRLGPGRAVARATVDRTLARPGEYAGIDRKVSATLPRTGFGTTVARGLLANGVRAADGSIAQILSLEHPATGLVVRTGRPPRRCDGRACEAIVVGGPDPRGGTVDVNGLRLRVVGRAALRPAAFGALGGQVTEGTIGQSPEGRYRTVGGGTRYVLAGVDAVADAPALRSVVRTYYWMRPLRADAVHPWNAGAVITGIERARTDLIAEEGDGQIAAPEAAIAAEQRRGRASARRLVLLASQAAIALLAFAAFAAVRRRASVRDERRRLAMAGARRWQLWCFVGLEATALAAVGALAGWLLALGGAVVAAAVRGADAGRVLAASVTSGEGVALAAGAWLAATAVVILFLRSWSARRPAVAARALEAAALAALAVLVWEAAGRGGVGADELASGTGTDPVLVLLPALLALVAGVAAARALPLLLRVGDRVTRRASVPVRLALLDAARNPRGTTVAVTFLAISLATALFALGYRASLVRGQHDQAAYLAAVDVRVQEAPRHLSGLPDVQPLGRYRALSGVRTAPVIREKAHLVGRETALQLLALPARALPRLSGWRDDFAGPSPSSLARRLRPTPRVGLRGPGVPTGTRAVRARARVRGTPVALSLALQQRDGTFSRLSLSTRLGPGSARIDRPLPARLAGARILAVGVGSPPSEEFRPLQGSVTLTPLTLAGRQTDAKVAFAAAGWQAAPGGRLAITRTGAATLSYQLGGALRATALRVRQPTAREPVPVIVSEAIARQADQAGPLLAQLDLGPSVDLRPVAVATQFPTVGSEQFAVADLGRLSAVLNTKTPGSVVPVEAWLSLDRDTPVPIVVRTLARAPFRSPTIHARAQLQRRLADDPLAQSVVWALLVASGLGLGLGLLGLGLVVAEALHDRAGELRDLETLGMPPSALRRQVRLRAAVVGVLSLAFGLAGAAALVALITTLVDIAANGTAPLPSLRPVDPWLQYLAALAAATVVLVALIVAQTRRAFRDDRPGRLHG